MSFRAPQLLAPDQPTSAFMAVSRSPRVFERLDHANTNLQGACWVIPPQHRASVYANELMFALNCSWQKEHDDMGLSHFWPARTPHQKSNAHAGLVKAASQMLPHHSGHSAMVQALSYGFRHLARLSDSVGSLVLRQRAAGEALPRTSRLPHYDPHNAWTLLATLTGQGTLVFDTSALDFTQLAANRQLLEPPQKIARIFGERPIPRLEILAPLTFQLPTPSIAIWRAGRIANPLLHHFPSEARQEERAQIMAGGYIKKAAKSL